VGLRYRTDADGRVEGCGGQGAGVGAGGNRLRALENLLRVGSSRANHTRPFSLASAFTFSRGRGRGGSSERDGECPPGRSGDSKSLLGALARRLDQLRCAQAQHRHRRVRDRPPVLPVLPPLSIALQSDRSR
jgi:hypothetical protein